MRGCGGESSWEGTGVVEAAGCRGGYRVQISAQAEERPWWEERWFFSLHIWKLGSKSMDKGLEGHPTCPELPWGGTGGWGG